MKDIYDGSPWTEMDVEDLTSALQLWRQDRRRCTASVSVRDRDEVRLKAEELGLSYKDC